MPEGVCCSAPCAFRSYNKYRQKKDGTYELSKLPGAGGEHGTCRHGTMINIGKMVLIAPIKGISHTTLDGKILDVWKPEFWVCQNFTTWETLLDKVPDAEHRRAK